MHEAYITASSEFSTCWNQLHGQIVHADDDVIGRLEFHLALEIEMGAPPAPKWANSMPA